MADTTVTDWAREQAARARTTYTLPLVSALLRHRDILYESTAATTSLEFAIYRADLERVLAIQPQHLLDAYRVYRIEGRTPRSAARRLHITTARLYLRMDALARRVWLALQDEPAQL